MDQISLTTPDANMAVCKVGTARLFFSFGSCIAFRRHDGSGLFNPAFRAVSTATASTATGHASKMGVGDLSNAETREQFERLALAAAAYIEVTAPDTYLDRFPLDHRASADRAYQDGFADGVGQHEES